MVRDKVHDPLRPTLLTQVTRTVKRVEARMTDLCRIADVMQPGGRHKRVPIGFGNRHCSLFGTANDGPHVIPTPTQGRDVLFGKLSCMVE